MKRLGEDLVTLFAQYSSAEFLSTLLSCLSNGNANGLSDVLKDIAQSTSASDVNTLGHNRIFDLLKVNVVPASVLPASGFILMKLLAEQGSMDEIVLRKYENLWNACDVSVYSDDTEGKYNYHESMKLLLEHWAIISYYVAKNLHPSLTTDQFTMTLTEFAEFHGANSAISTPTLQCSLNRFYLDVWEEELYLNKLGSSTKLKPLQNWSDMFHQYDSSVDGTYREWLLNQLDEKKDRFLKCPKKKRKIDPIFVPYDLTLSAENREDLMKVIPPPVPHSVIHPAAWSVRDNGNASTHPASWTASISSSSNGSTPNGKRGSSTLDDFTIAHEKLSSELKVIELANMVRLCRVKRFVDFRKNLELLIERKHRAEEVMCYAMTSDSVRANLRTMNLVRPVTAVLSNVDHHGSGGNNSSITNNSYGANNGHRKVKQECFWYVSAGIEQENGSNGDNRRGCLQELQAGQEVDLLMDSEWVVGRVLRLRKDRNFIRQAKVLPMGGGPTSAIWVSVEDELLAPLGSYTKREQQLN